MKVLICPLNWGLGHATRCVPIIRQLISEGHELTIVSDGYPLKFLELEFPSVRFIIYPSYSITYSSGNSQIFAIIKAFPKIATGIFREHFWLKNLLKIEHFDQIISDNRFGMWNKSIHSIYITHQLMVKMPQSFAFFEPAIHKLHAFFIRKYNECWIPDDSKKKLAGDLSNKYKLLPNAKFIGNLSRFIDINSQIGDSYYKVVAIVSGVEPQRSIFEKYIIEKYRNKNYKTLLLTGQPKNEQSKIIVGNIDIYTHISDSDFASYLIGAEKIICRSGYSTIMDLEALKCLNKAEFVPTPGQTEQEYLANLYKKPSDVII